MKRFIGVLLLTLCAPTLASAWWTGGHGLLTAAAVRATPEEVPAFFREGASFISHMVYDPDAAKNRATPLARGAEYGEHFADLEYIQGRPLPRTRYEFIKLCQEVGVAPEKVGFVPYAISEWTERLALAFAEHRQWPDNPHIRAKCQVYAGILAHYAQDACQPLHLTAHFNGWVHADGTIEQKGIHAKIDMMPEFLGMTPEGLADGLKVEPIDSLMQGVLDQIHSGARLVRRAYELGPRLPEIGQDDWDRDEEVVVFATGRAREAVRFTAALYLTAWRISADVELPEWLGYRKDTLIKKVDK